MWKLLHEIMFEKRVSFFKFLKVQIILARNAKLCSELKFIVHFLF